MCLAPALPFGDIKISADTTIVIKIPKVQAFAIAQHIKFKFKAPIDWTVSLLDNKLTTTPGYSYQWGDCETGL